MIDELLQVVGVVLEDTQGRIALQLRDDLPGVVNPGMWSIFGGKIEEGENPEQAVIREMKEELSIDLVPAKLYLFGEFTHASTVFFVFHYRVKDELDHAELKEGQDWRWCTVKEIRSMEINGSKLVDYHVAFLEQYWQQGIR
jgi:8-oxo-dGTP diphosphatase